MEFLDDIPLKAKADRPIVASDRSIPSISDAFNCKRHFPVDPMASPFCMEKPIKHTMIQRIDILMQHENVGARGPSMKG